MHYDEIPPTRRLAAWVRTCWSLTSTDSGTPGTPDARVEPVYPDGQVELIFHFGEPFRERGPGDALQPQADLLIGGPTTRPTWLARAAHSDVIGVRFWPGGSRLLGLPSLVALRDRVVAADELGLPWLRALHARLRRAPRGERFAALEQDLAERATRLAAPRLLPLAVQGMPRVAVACAGLGVSARQLERICLAETGLTPRELRRIQRFQRSLRLIETHPGTSFSVCAQAAGFADESHLSRDFRAIAGVTPGAFRRARSTLTAAFIGRDDVAFVQSDRSASRQTRRPITETS